MVTATGRAGSIPVACLCRWVGLADRVSTLWPTLAGLQRRFKMNVPLMVTIREMTMSLAQRISVEAHLSLPHANPLLSMQMTSLVKTLAERAPQTVLDVGCGPGTFSIELAKACPAAIRAIDINPGFLDRARASAMGQLFRGRIDFQDQAASALGAEQFDALVCIGSSQAFGTPTEALARCAKLVRAGGTVVFAELVWSSEPHTDFLGFLGEPRSLYWSEAQASAAFFDAGLVVARTETASRASWCDYETAIHRGRLAFANSLSESEAEQVRIRANDWANAYEQYGQHCLGFVAYVAEKAAA